MPYSNICDKICKRWHEKVHIFNTLTYPSIPNLFKYVAIVGRCESPLRVYIYIILFIRVYGDKNRDKIECANIFKDLRSRVYGFPPASIGPCLAPVQLLDLCLVCGL